MPSNRISRIHLPSSSPSTASVSSPSSYVTMSPGLSVSLPSPSGSSPSYTPAPTPAGHSSTSSSSVFSFRSTSIAPFARPTSPMTSPMLNSPFQVEDAADEERMRQIQQLAKRRRSSLLRADNTSAYSIPSPQAATSLHSSFAQLSLRPVPQPDSTSDLAAPRMPASARRLFSLDVASEGRESSRSSRKGSLKRAHDDDDDEYSQHSNTSPTTHAEEEQKQQEPETVQPAVAPRGQFEKRALRERPRRWTTGLVTPQDGNSSSSAEQPRAARPITPYVGSGAGQPVKPAPRSLFLQTAEEEDVEDGYEVSGFSFSFDQHTAAAPSIKRASLTSFLPLPPQSRPPTPLAAMGKRSTLPATFRLSSLTSLAESIHARSDEEEEVAVMEDKQQQVVGGSDKLVSGSSFSWSSSGPQVGGDFRVSRAGSNEGRRRSLAMAGARALVGGVQF